MSKQQERVNIHYDLVTNYGYSSAEAAAIANMPNIHDAHKAYRNAKAQGPRPSAQQPQAAAAPKAVKSIKPPVTISESGNVGVKKNTQTKSNKSGMTIARSANVVPLQEGAVGYSGLRIS